MKLVKLLCIFSLIGCVSSPKYNIGDRLLPTKNNPWNSVIFNCEIDGYQNLLNDWRLSGYIYVKCQVNDKRAQTSYERSFSWSVKFMEKDWYNLSTKE